MRALRSRRRLRFPLLILAAFVGLLSACDDELLNTIPEASDQVDIFQQKAAAQVDILWMIDNSDSMIAEQEKVASGFYQFFNQLIISQVDYHIGVITSDPIEEGRLRQYSGPAVDGCAACRFITKDTPCPNPAVDVSDLTVEADIEARLADECPAQLVFRKLIKVGTGGTSFEQGFVQAASALGVNSVDPTTGLPVVSVPDDNAGFLRTEASLYVVFVSDEDEGAKQDGTPIRYYQRLFEGLKGAGNENKVSIAAITGFPTENPPSPLADVCSILQTTYDTSNSNDDPRAAQLKEALRSSSCRDQLAPANDEAAVAETGGRYIELACRTGGVIANMCEAEYTTALDALGANAAGLVRKFTLSLPLRINNGPDCTLFGEQDNDPPLDCDGDGKTDGALDGPLCVKARNVGSAADAPLEIVPRDDINGWRWEDSTSSVRFDGAYLPAPGSTVEIKYLLRRANDKTCG